MQYVFATLEPAKTLEAVFRCTDARFRNVVGKHSGVSKAQHPVIRAGRTVEPLSSLRCWNGRPHSILLGQGGITKGSKLGVCVVVQGRNFAFNLGQCGRIGFFGEIWKFRGHVFHRHTKSEVLGENFGCQIDLIAQLFRGVVCRVGVEPAIGLCFVDGAPDGGGLAAQNGQLRVEILVLFDLAA